METINEQNEKINPADKIDLREVILGQQEILERIYENSEKTRRYILFGRILSFIYLLMIVAPIVFAIIYLPPMIEKIAQPYADLLNIRKTSDTTIDDELINNLLKILK